MAAALRDSDGSSTDSRSSKRRRRRRCSPSHASTRSRASSKPHRAWDRFAPPGWWRLWCRHIDFARRDSFGHTAVLASSLIPRRTGFSHRAANGCARTKNPMMRWSIETPREVWFSHEEERVRVEFLSVRDIESKGFNPAGGQSNGYECMGTGTTAFVVDNVLIRKPDGQCQNRSWRTDLFWILPFREGRRPMPVT